MGASTRIAVVALLLGVVSSAGPASSASKSPERQWVDTTLARMSLEEKVGQLFVISAYGLSVRDDNADAKKNNQASYGVDNFEQVIQRYHLGGFYLSAGTGNLHDPDQIVNLANGFQQVGLKEPNKIPLLISADQEGGTVQAIRSPAVVFPGNMALGATRDTGTAHDVAAAMGQELRAMGVNTDLAPVV